MASWRWVGALWVGVLPVAGVCAGAPADPGKELEGRWVVTAATRDGKALPNMIGGSLRFAGKELTLKDKKGLELTVPFKMDPAREPKTIDFWRVSDGGWLPINMDFRGIYAWDRGKLKLCLRQDKRPTDFSDKGAILLVLKREK
jgi:uncharacterized protein (TIGR03067 family)